MNSMRSNSSNHTPSRSRNILVAFSPSATILIGVVATTHPAVTAYTQGLIHEKGIYSVVFIDAEYAIELLAQALELGYAPSVYR